MAELTVEQAYTRYVLRLAPELGKENLQPIVPEATVELGYRYRVEGVSPRTTATTRWSRIRHAVGEARHARSPPRVTR